MSLEAEGLASVAYVNFLAGIGLAAWARSNARSVVFWLLFGWLLTPLAAVVMLVLHWRDTRKPAPEFSVFPQTGRSDLMSTRKDVI